MSRTRESAKRTSVSRPDTEVAAKQSASNAPYSESAKRAKGCRPETGVTARQSACKSRTREKAKRTNGSRPGTEVTAKQSARNAPYAKAIQKQRANYICRIWAWRCAAKEISGASYCVSDNVRCKLLCQRRANLNRAHSATMKSVYMNDDVSEFG